MQQDSNVFTQLSASDEEKILASIPGEVKGYLQQILIDGGLRDVDSDIMDEMIVQLYVRFNQFLVGEIAKYLPEEKLEEFANIAENNPTQDIIKEYLLKNLPNAQDVFTIAFAKFREIYLEGVNSASNPQAPQLTE